MQKKLEIILENTQVPKDSRREFPYADFVRQAEQLEPAEVLENLNAKRRLLMSCDPKKFSYLTGYDLSDPRDRRKLGMTFQGVYSTGMQLGSRAHAPDAPIEQAYHDAAAMAKRNVDLALAQDGGRHVGVSPQMIFAQLEQGRQYKELLDGLKKER